MKNQKRFHPHRRKSGGPRAKPLGRVSHHGRSPIVGPIPVLAAWRVRNGVGLRGKKLLRTLRRSFRKCRRKPGFQVTHFAVRGAEVSMIVEVDDLSRLSRGMQGLGVSMARRLNRSARRRGPAFDDRFAAQALRTAGEWARAHERLRIARSRGSDEPPSGDLELALVVPPLTGLPRVGRPRKALPAAPSGTGPPRSRWRWFKSFWLRWSWPSVTSRWLRERLRGA